VTESQIMHMMKLQRSLILLFLLCLSLNAIAALEFKIIPLQHRFAEDILPSIQPLVSGNGTISAMQNNLIIRTSPENMAEIERIISTLDVARQNLRIAIKRQAAINTEASNASISARKRIGNVEVSTSNHPAHDKNSAHIALENRQIHTQNSSDQFINVTDGESAFISVGQSVPFTQEWITLTRRYIHMQRTTEFTDVTTGFSVRPRSIGEQVEVKISPRIAQLNQNGYIDFEQLTTTVRVNRGEWLDLSSLMTQKDEVSRAILSWKSSRNSQNNQLSIRVD